MCDKQFWIMIINIVRSTSVFFSFCLFSFLLLTIAYVNGQNDNLSSPAQQQQQPNSKVNSININNRSVTNGNKEPQASDSVVIKKKYSNLNSKYETQSTVTSTTSIGLFPGPKKSEYLT